MPTESHSNDSWYPDGDSNQDIDYWNYSAGLTEEYPQYAEQQQPVQQIRSDYLQQQPYNGASVY
eukprot:6161948-Amphidinium_carterae.1